ncbi:MAG: alpha/beta fold hydrolase [Alphaproteobacteria bacterium]|nr:alpha/beta fold hydrolase [Alphaproteobacteria bacterium]
MTQGDITNIYDWGPASGTAPKQIVLLLHGLGSNGRDLISLAPYYAHALPDAVFVSPDAPFACDMVPPGYPDSYQWFSLQSRDPEAMLEGAQAAQPILNALIDQLLQQHNLPADQLALLGFSQGTMMSLYSAPRYSQKIAGVLGYSGALLGEGELAQAKSKPPIHLIHGEADDVVPVAAYAHAKQALEAAGFEISGHTAPGLTHSIDEAGIESGAAFLKEVFSA